MQFWHCVRTEPVAILLYLAFASSTYAVEVSGVVEDLTSEVIKNATVRLLSLDRVRQTTTTSLGAFRFADVQPGSYTIEAERPGFHKRTLPLVVPPDHPSQSVEIVLQVGPVPDTEHCGGEVSIRYQPLDSSGVSISGVIRNYIESKPLARAKVLLISASARQPVLVLSDAAGNFSASHLPPDSYAIRISLASYKAEQCRDVIVPRENKVWVEATLVKEKYLIVCQ